jgi:hypothetical protein
MTIESLQNLSTSYHVLFFKDLANKDLKFAGSALRGFFKRAEDTQRKERSWPEQNSLSEKWYDF